MRIAAADAPRTTPATSARGPLLLLAVFALVFALLAIAPETREDWLLENLLVFATLGWLLWGWRHLRLSNSAYVLLFTFVVIHEIGAHYQYSNVPYDAWFGALSGGRSLDALLGFERNQFDRFVHFLYGLLITPVAAEIIDSKVRPRGTWLFLLPVTFMMSHAVIYELIEWLAASVFGGALGEAYLGTQGDAWDAHKDMLLATLGSLIAQTIWLLRRRVR